MSGFTQIDIVNLALVNLGETPLTSIDENTKTARVIKQIYQLVKTAELRANNWNFAIQRRSLAAGDPISYDTRIITNADGTTTTTYYNVLNEYQLPSECLKLLYVNDYFYTYNTLIEEDGQSYQIEQNKIITRHTGPLKVRYIKNIEAPFYDSLFIDVLSIAIALRISQSITQSNQKTAGLEAMYQASLQRALEANAFEQVPVLIPDQSFNLSRY